MSVPIARSQTPAATRAADPPDEPPEVLAGSRGIAGVPDPRVGEAGGELQALRGGEHLRARRAEPADQRRVLGRRRATGRRAAAPGRQPGDRDDVLDHDGPPGQGTRRSPARRARDRDHGVERASQPVEALVGGEQVQVLLAAGPRSRLDRGDQLCGPPDQESPERAEDRLGFSLAAADCQVAVDPRVRLARPPVEVREPGQRSRQVVRVEPVKRQRPHRRLPEHFPGDREEQRVVGGVVEHLVNRQVADGGREQHRAVGLLAPDEPHDLRRRLRVGDIGGQRVDPRGRGPVNLPDLEGAPVAAHHHTRCEHVGTEIDARLDHPA